METERAAKLTIILGTNGTGKTTLLRHILESSNERSLVITPDDIEWNDYPEVDLSSADDFKQEGIVKTVYNPAKKGGTLEKLRFFTRGNLVFDDCRAYLKASTADEIHALLVRRRQRMIDVFAVGHGFNEVPPVFFTFASEIILFRTVDNIDKRKDCIRDFQLMKKTYIEVNKKAVSDPHFFKVIKF